MIDDTALSTVKTVMLILLLVLFSGVVLWLFRPGGRRDAEQASTIPFRGDGDDGR